jgi:hypothetical protein
VTDLRTRSAGEARVWLTVVFDLMAGDPPEQLTTEEFARWWKETGEHELRQILLWRRDPIGVADFFPNTAEEYDGYAPQIVQSLRNGASPET